MAIGKTSLKFFGDKAKNKEVKLTWANDPNVLTYGRKNYRLYVSMRILSYILTREGSDAGLD